MNQSLTLEDEKQLVVLLAITELGGAAPKGRVLDLIEAKGWLHLDDEDQEVMQSRNEQRWRNDLAFTRHHLVLADCVSGTMRNRWMITPSGSKLLHRLVRLASTARLRKLTRVCAERMESVRRSQVGSG